MPLKSSRLENEEPGRSVRVILFGGVEAESFGEDFPFEIHRCEDLSQVTRFWEEAEASVLLIDLERLSDGERAHLRKQMAQFNTVLVLAIADSIDDKACENLLRMGCVGSLRRRQAPATLLRALKAVIAGELWFPRTTLSRVLRGFLAAQDPNRLTSREMEILGLVGGDLNNQQIADKLFISRETVRWHIKGLNAKLGIRTRRGLRDHVRVLHRLGKAMPEKRELGNNPTSRAAS
jgi:DNA-binding NarL/FixJ family response regulator